MKIVYALLIALLLAVSAMGQTPLTGATLPTYILGGASHNQYTGWAGLISGIVPESNTVGLYGSITADITAAKTVDPASGKEVWLLSPSFRVGQHKVLYPRTGQEGKSMLLVGGDLGPSFIQPTSGSTGIAMSLSGSLTLTFIRQIHPHWGVAVPVRMLWLSGAGPGGAGAWNPVVELGMVWKP